MPAIARPHRLLPPLSLGRRAELALFAVALLAASLLLRSATFGDPLAGYDEQFYLLAGSRMLDGAVPYVDLWDRKPIGLFLVYAFARLLGGDGVLQYQLLAAICVAGTGLLIALHVRRRFPPATALGCGLLYVVWVATMGGEDGQAPLFYNPLVAGAALLTLDALAQGKVVSRGAAAMALCGLALTVKTTVVFEGCFLGLALVLARWQQTRDLRGTALAAALFMSLGALPFALSIAWYAAIGQLDSFWFANAASAALRRDGWTLHALHNLSVTLVPLAPVLLMAAAGLAFPRVGQPAWERRFLGWWIAAALLGFVSVGYFYQHYALPLLVPLVIATAPFLAGWRHAGLALLLVCAVPVASQVGLNRLFADRQRAQAAALVEAIPPQVRTRCMLVYGGPPILYHLTDACLVTRFAFPNHLYSAGEAPALGIDQVEALRRALAAKPLIITTETDVYRVPRNPAADALVAAELARNYRVRAVRRHQFHENDLHTLTVWERR